MENLKNGINEIEIYYPGYVRKALSFTIDDGNVPNDKKFIDIVKPYGIKGTFNLCSHNISYFSTREEYIEFYDGYEIANHCKYHPFAFRDDTEYKFADEPFDENTTDTSLVYKAKIDKQYMYKVANGWRMITDADTYLLYDEQSRRELEEFFGKPVNGFVWPYGLQKNQKVYDELCKRGYYGLRKTGDTLDLDGFAIPRDRNNWSYNANNVSLLKVAKMYEEYPDDGELKFFCFGVHSVDFERSGNWHELKEYAEHYGNRPNDYWYASVGEVFAYEDAAKALKVSKDKIINGGEISVFLKIDGKEVEIKPNTEYLF